MQDWVARVPPGRSETGSDHPASHDAPAAVTGGHHPAVRLRAVEVSDGHGSDGGELALGGAPTSSDQLNTDSVGMSSKRLEVGGIAGQNGAVRLREADEEGVDGGSSRSEPTKLCRTSRELYGDCVINDARLEEAVDVGITSGMALQRFDLDHGRDNGWP